MLSRWNKSLGRSNSGDFEPTPIEGQYVISVFFEGTGGNIEDNESISSALRNLCLSDTVLGYSGCDKHSPYGQVMGTIFAQGVTVITDQLIKEIAQQLKANPNKKIIVNMYGFSRGAVTPFRVSNAVADNFATDLRRIEVNIACYEPVTGNDFVGAKNPLAFVNDIRDLSKHHFINSVLILCGNGNTFGGDRNRFFVPVIPKFHSTTTVIVDAVIGNHPNAQMITSYGNQSDRIHVLNAISGIVFDRVFEFLKAHGSRFKDPDVTFANYIYTHAIPPQGYSDANKRLLIMYIYLFNLIRRGLDNSLITGAIIRPTHSGEEIITRPYDLSCQYINIHHKMLAQGDPKNLDINPVTLAAEDYADVMICLARGNQPVLAVEQNATKSARAKA
jgi:hypothetical protein